MTLILLALTLLHAGQGHGPHDATEVRWWTEGDHRYLESNGLPSHETGEFPNAGNPNAIAEQRHRYRMPLEPRVVDEPTPAGGWVFGVAVNGVPFDPFTAETFRGDHGWRYEALTGGDALGMDPSNAHVQPDGTYHYHALPRGLIDRLLENHEADQMLLIGYAADGFPMYANLAHEVADDPASPLVEMRPSYRVREGRRDGGPGGDHDGTFVQDWEYVEGLGDLDEANGRVGVTPEHPDGTYYYVVTEAYPFVPRLFAGTPDAGFRKGPPSGRQDRQRRGPPRRR